MTNITINLFGGNGQRTIEIQPKGGFQTRHIITGAPTETPPATITPDQPVSEPTETEKAAALLNPPSDPNAPRKRPLTPDAIADVLVKMDAYEKRYGNERRFFALSEILKVATTQCDIRADHTTLLEVLRVLWHEKRVEHQKNRFGHDCFRLTRNTTDLHALLAEVDAILANGKGSQK